MLGRRCNRACKVTDAHHTGKHLVWHRELAVLQCDLEQCVLGHLERRVCVAQLLAQRGDFSHGQALVAQHHYGPALLQALRVLINKLLLFFSSQRQSSHPLSRLHHGHGRCNDTHRARHGLLSTKKPSCRRTRRRTNPGALCAGQRVQDSLTCSFASAGFTFGLAGKHTTTCGHRLMR